MTARDAATGVVLGQDQIAVSPDDASWSVELEVNVAEGQTSVVVMIELVHIAANGQTSIEWSGVSPPILLVPGQTGSPSGPVTLYPGPPSNLLVTAVGVSPKTATLQVGEARQLNATVNGPASSVVRWTSLNAVVADVSGSGQVSALRSGVAQVVASAGPRADTAVITVVDRVGSVRVTPDSVRLTAIGQEASYTAQVLDTRGVAMTGGAVTWTITDANIADHVGNGRYRAKAAGRTTVRATSQQDPSISGNALLIVAQTFTITTSASPAAGGSTSGGGSFASGASVTVVATPNSGYTFVRWTDGGNQVSTNASYNFTATADRALVAVFQAVVQQFTITTSSNPVAGGSTSGGGIFNSGTSATVVATANSGFTFASWTEAGVVVSTSPSFTFTVSANRALVANFQLVPPTQFTITTSSNPTAGGSTSGGGAYNSGASATVLATPNAGYTFANWTEGATVVSTSASYTFTVTANRSLVANFQIAQYSLVSTTNPPLGGSLCNQPPNVIVLCNTVVLQISRDSMRLAAGSVVTMNARANTGYTFVNWTEGATVVSTSSGFSLTLNSNRNLVANFQVTPTQYTVATSANPSAGGNTSGGGTFNSGASATVVATPNSGYSFVNWTEGGTVVSSSANYTFSVTANRTLVANFQIAQYSLVSTTNPALGGSLCNQPQGSIVLCNTVVLQISRDSMRLAAGTIVSMGARANAGYTFVNWTEGSTVVSTSNGFNLTLNSNRNLVANFQVTPTATVSVSSPTGGGSGTVTSTPAGINCQVNGSQTSGTCSGPFPLGQPVTLTPSPQSGSTFNSWQDAGTGLLITDAVLHAPYTFTLTGNRGLMPNFGLTAPQYSLQISFNWTTANSGSIRYVSSPAGIDCTTYAWSGEGTCAALFTAGSNVTLTATPGPGSSHTWIYSCYGASGQCAVAMNGHRTVASMTTGPNPIIGGFPTGAVTRSPTPQTVGIGGQNFQSGATVEVTNPGGSITTFTGTQVQFVNTGRLNITLVVNTPGFYAVKVINPNGLRSNVLGFTVF